MIYYRQDGRSLKIAVSGLTQLHYQWWMVGNYIEFPTLQIAPLRKSYVYSSEQVTVKNF